MATNPITSVSPEEYLRLDSQLRVHMPRTGLYAYPDLVMACADETFGPFDTLQNPLHIIEVLSPSTEDYDRGGKFESY